MVLIILTALGILFLCLGSSLGILLLVPGVIAIIINIVKAINESNERSERIAKEKWERVAREQAEEQEKQQILQKQYNLTERYKASSLIKEVIRVISAGNPDASLPEEIIITDNYILGKIGGNEYTFDFASNRIHSFPSVICSAERNEELKYKAVRPQLAMAEAINCLMDNKYAIYDRAKHEYTDRQDCDGDWYHIITYISDHVVMVLKSTLPNKHF